jgi:DNA-binding MarR family transcriptional regulator
MKTHLRASCTHYTAQVTDEDLTATGAQVAQALGALLLRGTRAALYLQLTEGLGLDETAYPVLSGLARTGPLSAAALAHEVGVDRSGVSRHADKLEATGLLRRQPDPADGRATLLVLTERGEQASAVMRGRLADLITSSLRDWPPAEAAAFARALHRFATHGPFQS